MSAFQIGFRRFLQGVVTKPWSVAAGPLTLEMLLEKPRRPTRHDCGDAVAMYSQVCLRELDGSDKYSYTIVTPEENDPDQGRLSCCSPLGFALLGKRKGDELTVSALFGNRRFVVEKVKCCQKNRQQRVRFSMTGRDGKHGER